METEQKDLDLQLRTLYEEIRQKQDQLTALKKQSRQPVRNYELTGNNGERVPLADLFGDKGDLIVIHNMGARCPMCTLWADGFNGVYPHLENRAAFVVVSMDAHEQQQEFAAGRGWKFPMYSDSDKSFTQDLGFAFEQEGKAFLMPGVSTFRKLPDGSIERVGKDFFGPGDPYGLVYPLFDLLEEGIGEWFPSFSYETTHHQPINNGGPEQMPRVVHFEIAADQPERASTFYKNVFDWNIQKWEGPQDYWLVTTGKEGEMGINGGIMQRPDPATRTINTIDVPSVDQFTEKITNNGGTIVMPKMAIPNIGWLAYCQDTEGNVFGIMEGDSSAQ